MPSDSPWSSARFRWNISIGGMLCGAAAGAGFFAIIFGQGLNGYVDLGIHLALVLLIGGCAGFGSTWLGSRYVRSARGEAAGTNQPRILAPATASTLAFIAIALVVVALMWLPWWNVPLIFTLVRVPVIFGLLTISAFLLSLCVFTANRIVWEFGTGAKTEARDEAAARMARYRSMRGPDSP